MKVDYDYHTECLAKSLNLLFNVTLELNNSMKINLKSCIAQFNCNAQISNTFEKRKFDRITNNK